MSKHKKGTQKEIDEKETLDIDTDKTIKELQETIEMEIKEDDYEQRIKELEDKVLRLQAETQNYKRRKDEETKSLIKYANEGLIEELLPVLDNFERAIKLDDLNLDDELSKFLEGFKLIYSSFINVLKTMDLKEIEAFDKHFDPVYHQAVLIYKDESKEDGIILEVLQKGYMLKDRVIRASLVKVNNK